MTLQPSPIDVQNVMETSDDTPVGQFLALTLNNDNCFGQAELVVSCRRLSDGAIRHWVVRGGYSRVGGGTPVLHAAAPILGFGQMATNGPSVSISTTTFGQIEINIQPTNEPMWWGGRIIGFEVCDI